MKISEWFCEHLLEVRIFYSSLICILTPQICFLLLHNLFIVYNYASPNSICIIWHLFFFFSRSADCVLPHGDMQSHVAIATYQLLIYSTYITFWFVVLVKKKILDNVINTYIQNHCFIKSLKSNLSCLKENKVFSKFDNLYRN